MLQMSVRCLALLLQLKLFSFFSWTCLSFLTYEKDTFISAAFSCKHIVNYHPSSSINLSVKITKEMKIRSGGYGASSSTERDPFFPLSIFFIVLDHLLRHNWGWEFWVSVPLDLKQPTTMCVSFTRGYRNITSWRCDDDQWWSCFTRRKKPPQEVTQHESKKQLCMNPSDIPFHPTLDYLSRKQWVSHVWFLYSCGHSRRVNLISTVTLQIRNGLESLQQDKEGGMTEV